MQAGLLLTLEGKEHKRATALKKKDRDDSARVATENGKEVDQSTSPPPQGHFVQAAADANPPGPPGLAGEMESEEADYQ